MTLECSFRYVWLALFFFFSLSSRAAFAQLQQFEGKRISRIEYSPAQILDPADLQKAQPLKEGTSLDPSDVADAIDGLFATGRFADIAVEAEPSGDGVAVRFMTEPQWFVGGIMSKVRSPRHPIGER